MAFALQARYVFPVDQPPIEHGVVTIDRERIVEVGPKTTTRDITDLGDVALLPGLVNCHTHLEFSHLEKPLGKAGMQLPEWIRLVIAERGQRTTQSGDPIETGLREGVACGTAMFGEIAAGAYDMHHNDVGLLAPFVEVIGFSRARSASAYAATRNALSLYGGRRDVGISPHAPYTVSPDLLRNLVSLARDELRPVAMHLAESEQELELLRSGSGPFQELLDERSMWDATAIPRGSRPLDYLQMLAEAPRSLVIHGNYLVDGEHDFLASHADRMSLVYCPRTHAYFGHSPYPLPQLLRKGVRIVIGTDSRASNPDLNFFEELRHVFGTYPSIDPETLLRMGTLDGATALGCDMEMGSITPGKYANLVAMPLRATGISSADALASVFDGNAKPLKAWLRGVEA